MIVGNLPMTNVGLPVDKGQREADNVTSSIHPVSGLHVLQISKQVEKERRERERERQCDLSKSPQFSLLVQFTLSTTTSPLPVIGSPESFKNLVAGTTPRQEEKVQVERIT